MIQKNYIAKKNTHLNFVFFSRLNDQLKQDLNDVTNEKKDSDIMVRELESNLSRVNVNLQTCQNKLSSYEQELKDCSKTLVEKNYRIEQISLDLNSCEDKMLRFKEQVRKLSVCHGELFYRTSPSINIKEISPKEYSCSAVDVSEREGCSQVLIARFKMVEDGGAFKAEFDRD